MVVALKRLPVCHAQRLDRYDDAVEDAAVPVRHRLSGLADALEDGKRLPVHRWALLDGALHHRLGPFQSYWHTSQSGSSMEQAAGTAAGAPSGASEAAAVAADGCAAVATAFNAPDFSSVDFSALVAPSARR